MLAKYISRLFVPNPRRGKVAFQVLLISMGRKSLLDSSCITDPPRRQALGAVKVQSWRGLFAEPGTSAKNYSKPARISRKYMRVLGLMCLMGVDFFHKQVKLH